MRAEVRFTYDNEAQSQHIKLGLKRKKNTQIIDKNTNMAWPHKMQLVRS